MDCKWVYIGVFLFFVNCKDAKKQVAESTAVISGGGIDIPVYDFENFKPLMHSDDDKVRVINFWATWCKPCVAELPYFELINGKYKGSGVEVILVSLDLPKHVESKLIPFIKRQRIESKVVLLDDPDANSWIPKVNKSWSGSIPATLICKGNNSVFYERSFTYDELEKELKKVL